MRGQKMTPTETEHNFYNQEYWITNRKNNGTSKKLRHLLNASSLAF